MMDGVRIAAAEVRPCTQALHDPSWTFARAQVPRLEGHVLVLRDADGVEGLGYVHAIPAISMPGAAAAALLQHLRPWLLGRPVDDIGATMAQLDVALAGAANVKAAVDMALHDLLARRLGVPVHVLLGGAQRGEVVLSRILAIQAPAAMAGRAAALAAEGYRQLKLKLSGDAALDVDRVAAVRDAVGPDVVLTLDPNQSYAAKPMLAAFARMAPHGVALIEQPVPASDWAGLALLTRELPVAVEADESAGTVHDVFRLVADRVVDAVNLKLTKLGGYGRFVEAVRLCEAGGVACRVGAAFGPALLQAAALQAACVVRRLPYGCELAEHLHLHDDPFAPLPATDGTLRLPGGPGCGIGWAG